MRLGQSLLLHGVDAELLAQLERLLEVHVGYVAHEDIELDLPHEVLGQMRCRHRHERADPRGRRRHAFGSVPSRESRGEEPPNLPAAFMIPPCFLNPPSFSPSIWRLAPMSPSGLRLAPLGMFDFILFVAKSSSWPSDMPV